MINSLLVSLFMLCPIMDSLSHEIYAEPMLSQDSTVTTVDYNKKATDRQNKLIAKYGHSYGEKLARYELALGMSKAMCLEVCDQRCYDITFSQSSGGTTYETWVFNYDKTLNALAEDSGDKSKALVLFELTESMYGITFRREVENSVKFKRIQFKNNKLILFEK